MAEAGSKKTQGIRGTIRAAFRSKDKSKDSTPSFDTSGNESLEAASVASKENQKPVKRIVSSDERDSGISIDKSAADEDISIALWNEAYEKMRDGSDEGKKQLIITYEYVLTTLTSNVSSRGKAPEDDNRFENCDRKSRMAEMKSTAELILEQTEKHSKAREYVIQGAQIFDQVKETISSALTAYPPAALAFSGLCATLPFLMKPLKQTKAMADGLSHILKSLTWYMALSRLLLKDSKVRSNLADFQSVLKDRIVDLYQSLLEYQIKCTIRRFDTYRVVRVAKAIIGLEDWDGTLNDFSKLEEAIRADTMCYNDEMMKDFAAKSNENERDIVSELRQMNQQNQQEMTGKFNSWCKEYMERNNPKPVRGTCLWFAGHDEFQEWINGESNLLAVSADPGCGKSVLSRHLVESVLPQKCPNWFVCHFFFKDEGDQKSLSTGLSCIIHQLLSQTESLSKPAKKKIIEAGIDGLKKWRVLWDILLLLLREIDDVIILLDALDEMDPSDFQDLTRKLKEDLSPNTTAVFNVKVLVTTRPYDFITRPLKSIHSRLIHLRGEGDTEIAEIQGEIRLVVQQRFQEFKNDHDYLEIHVIEALEKSLGKKGKDQKSYLWVKLVFELLENDTSYTSLTEHWEGLIDTISKGHIEIYEKLLQLVSTEDKEDVRIVLSLVIGAVSPLTIEQVDIALAVRKGFLSNPNAQHTNEKSLGCRGNRMSNWIRSTCRCFVTVYDSRVYFIHQTAKEFLLQLETSAGMQPSSPRWHKSISMFQAYATACECWIAYIRIIQLEYRSAHLYSFQRTFLDHGLLHFRRCQVFEPIETAASKEAPTIKVLDVSETFQSSYFKLLDETIDDQDSWPRRMYSATFRPNESPAILSEGLSSPISSIVFASFFGHYNALVYLVRKHPNWYAADAGRAVIAAATGNNTECLQYLLSQNYMAKPAFELPIYRDCREFPDPYEKTALHWAAIWGNRTMAQVLITNGANVNAGSRSDTGRTPIFDTIRTSWSRLEWDREVYLGEMSLRGTTQMLYPAIDSGCQESDWDKSLMKLFVDNGASLNLSPSELLGENILREAIGCQDENAVRFLLQHCGVDPNEPISSLDSGPRPLHLALDGGYPPFQDTRSRSICMLLIDSGADASVLCTRIMALSSHKTAYPVSNVSLLHILLSSNDRDEELLAALLEAGGKHVVNTKATYRGLLEPGELGYIRKFAGKSWEGATCLHRLAWAHLIGSFRLSNLYSLTQKLVRNGAILDEQDAAGMTVLHIFCRNPGTPGAAFMLLHLRADPTLKDERHLTASQMVRNFYPHKIPDDWKLFLDLWEAYVKPYRHQITELADVE